MPKDKLFSGYAGIDKRRVRLLLFSLLSITAFFAMAVAFISVNRDLGYEMIVMHFVSALYVICMVGVIFVQLVSVAGPANDRLSGFNEKSCAGSKQEGKTETIRCQDLLLSTQPNAVHVLTKGESAMKETLDSITDVITIIDKNFNIIYANRAAREMLSLNDTGRENMKCFKYYHGTEFPPKGCPSCQCMTSQKEASFEIFEPHLQKHIEIRALPRYDEAGNLTGLVHISRDITDRKTIEMRMNRQIEWLRALRTIDMAISASLDLNITLEVFLQQVKTQLKVDAASVMLYNPETQVLKYSAGKGFLTNRIKKVSIRAGESLAGRVILKREKLLISDFSVADPSSAGKDEQAFAKSFLIQEEAFRSYCALPFIAKGNVNGVLEIFNRSAFFPDDDLMEFLEALAGQAAIAIDNATLFERLQQSREDIMMAYDTTIEGWAMALDIRDNVTKGHSKRVCDLTVRIAREIGISDDGLLHIRRGALLHDIGKLGVPDSILHKPSDLNAEEWSLMKQHPQIAYELISRIPFLEKAVDIPYCHHEKWDGTGYPRGLKKNEIPLSARIFTIVDIWDALCSDRPYRRAWERERVIEHISANSGSHLDPELVEIFMKVGIE